MGLHTKRNVKNTQITTVRMAYEGRFEITTSSLPIHPYLDTQSLNIKYYKLFLLRKQISINALSLKINNKIQSKHTAKLHARQESKT